MMDWVQIRVPYDRGEHGGSGYYICFEQSSDVISITSVSRNANTYFHAWAEWLVNPT
jgi:hypothetical protein